MRFSDLAGKEVVDLHQGVKLGVLGEADIVFEAQTGKVRAIVLAERGSWFHRGREIVIPWRGVRKIGVDLIVVDMSMAMTGEELADQDASDDPATLPEGSRRGRGSTYFPRER